MSLRSRNTPSKPGSRDIRSWAESECNILGEVKPGRRQSSARVGLSHCRCFSMTGGSMQIYFYPQLDLDGFRISNQIPSQGFPGNSKAVPIPSCPLNIPRVSSSLLQSGCSYLTSWFPPGERINQRIEKNASTLGVTAGPAFPACIFWMLMWSYEEEYL